MKSNCQVEEEKKQKSMFTLCFYSDLLDQNGENLSSYLDRGGATFRGALNTRVHSIETSGPI